MNYLQPVRDETDCEDISRGAYRARQLTSTSGKEKMGSKLLLRSHLQEVVARVVISGISLHSIMVMVVRERRGPVPSVGATHHLNRLNVSRELGFRVTSCLPSILYIAYKELAFSSFVSDDTSLPKPVGRCRRHK